MATDKQIAANRANALKSTGPRTPAGRSRAAQNARRHGLSVPQDMDLVLQERALRLANKILREHDHDRSDLAFEVAAAQVYLERIADVRGHLMRSFNLDAPSTEQIWRLASIDRYEHNARRRGRRALLSLRFADRP